MQLRIEKLVYGGDGLARTEQGVIFVPRTAPGDVVDVEITHRKKDYASGRVVEMIAPSADRQEPACPNYMAAGCCHWEHIRYDRQLEYKEAIIRESLTRLARIEFAEPIATISGPDKAYRLRASFHVRDGRLGFVREHSNTIVPVDRCSALVPELNAFVSAANTGLDRAALGVDVVAGPAIAATIHFDANTERPWDRVRDRMFQAIPGLASLTFVIGSKHLRFDKHPAEIEVGGFRFGLNSNAFFQANRFLLEPFMKAVLGHAGSGHSKVLDLFSGSGFFSIPLASASRQLIGVETSRDAVRQAIENARVNAVWNVEFAAGNVDTILAGAEVDPDLVVLNPPRTGAGVKVAERVAGLKASRLVYVSCNPTTFAREAAVFLKNGYRLSGMTMVDQFPNTYHIELIARFDLE